MKMHLKKLSEQTIVITGATSGIGLVTAREAARQGARLVLAARNEDALKTLCEELNAYPPVSERAIHVVADVGDADQVRRIADAAIARFGGFDTWVNNAGVSIFGRMEDVSMEDQRRLFETNFWGVVHGSMVAVEHLKQRGGALINLGSEVSDRAVPLQGMYSASKHAVKGFTESLRSELESQRAPVSVTLVKPAAIDTMFVAHAKNYMEVEPQLPPPIYAPESVAEAILHAAQHPMRDVFVGSGAKLVSASSHYTPRLLDRVMARFMVGAQRTDRPSAPGRTDALHEAGLGLHERSGQSGGSARTSVYTRASLHPRLTAVVALGAGAAGLGLASLLRKRRRSLA